MEVDMLILSLIVFAFLSLLFTIFVFLWYSGLFLKLDIKTCKSPFSSLEVAYKFAKGPYKESGALFTEAHSLAPNLRCIGIYYDNATEIHGKMRYIIGLILNDEEHKVDEETKNLILQKGFQIVSFPEVEYVVYSSFPHKSSISVLIAVNRLIPSFKEYIKERSLSAYPLIEICDGKEIVYAAPLSKQEAFFVPEALVESEEATTSDQKTVEETEEASVRDAEELQPDTASSVDSLAEGQSHDQPSLEIIDNLEENNKNGMTNGSEASTESFEELQLDS